MELLCPHCQQKLTIPDQFAGQLMRCPLCNGTFTAPALGPPPAASPTVPPPVPIGASPYSFVPESAPPPPPVMSPEPLLRAQPPPVKEVAPPLPPGDYSRSCTVWISPRIVPWIPRVGLLLIFFLTFFPWTYGLDGPHNAWGWGLFGDVTDPLIGVYSILTVLALILSMVSTLFALGLLPTPPPVQMLGPWQPLIVGGVALLAFFFLAIKYLEVIFSPALTPATIWLKLGFRLHFLVLIAALLEFWLELRRKKNLPLPRIEMHW